MSDVHSGDGVDALLDRAEVMLSLVEHPESTSDRLAYAVAASNIALTRTMRGRSGAAEDHSPPSRGLPSGHFLLSPSLQLPSQYPKEHNHLPHSTRMELGQLGIHWNYTVEIVRYVMRRPDFHPEKKIMTIKNLRQAFSDAGWSVGLKIAKDIVDYSASNHGWWDSPQ